jgi:N-acetylglucosaminyl-diphospho-decaprenol L-rhamnosyltransferase
VDRRNLDLYLLDRPQLLPSLDIILVNRNSGSELFDCLSSIVRADHTAFRLCRVCVVDDGSTDNSATGLAEILLPLEIIRNSEHTGYGASCNRGAESSTADYILFLNTDSLLLADSLDKPILYLEQTEHARVGIVGIQLTNAEGAVARSCAQFPKLGRMITISLGLDNLFPSVFPSHQMKRWDHLDTREVDQVIGAFMLMRRALFERLGGYDEQFFVYMEDLDVSLRMRYLGYASVFLASAHACHAGGGTARRSQSESLFFVLRSRIQYAFKHFGTLRGCVVAGVVLCAEPVARIGSAVLHRRGDKIKATSEAYVRLWKELLSGRLSDRIRRGELIGSRKRESCANSDDDRLMDVTSGASIRSEGGN